MRKDVKPWTEEENKTLVDYYPAEGINVSLRLPGRTIAAIKNHAQQLNVFNRKQMTGWLPDELEILRKYYPIEGKCVANRLKNRTVKTVQVMANRLGIKRKFAADVDREVSPKPEIVVDIKKESGVN